MSIERKTFAELKDKLGEIMEEECSEFAYETVEVCEGYDEENGQFFGKVTEVFQEGGEGEGEHWEVVYHFEDHDVYMQLTGSYYSHDGTYFDTWDDITEVRPVQKTITVYE